MRVIEELEREKEYKLGYSKYVEILQRNAPSDKLREFSDLRLLPYEEVCSSGIFYIGNSVELMIPDYIGRLEEFGVISPTNNKPIYNNRWVIPILDIHGQVQNLVGYSNEVKERYIYATGIYYRRNDTLYGLENFNLAYELGYAIITEGITDTMRIRSLGYKNTFAMCGTHKSVDIMTQLNRLRYGIIRIPDRDKPGKATESHWITNQYITLHTPIRYKDSDEFLREGREGGREKETEYEELFKYYLDTCIDEITVMEHRGRSIPPRDYTMI